MKIISPLEGKIIINKLKLMIEQRNQYYYPEQSDEVKVLIRTIQWLEELSLIKQDLLDDVKSLFERLESHDRRVVPDYDEIIEISKEPESKDEIEKL